MRVERYLSQRDAATLCRIAEQLLRVHDAKLYCADRLVQLISSSVLLPGHAERDDCVALMSEVTYRRVGHSETHTVVLVGPGEANDALGHLSVLAPLAMALLGRTAGSIVEVTPGAGHVEYVEILALAQASASLSTERPAAAGRLDALPYLKKLWPSY